MAAAGQAVPPPISRRGTATLVADARLDNRDELSAALNLDARGSDAGLLLAAFERWGMDALPRFIGAFAIAFYDSATRDLLLVRDAIGERPLFYAMERDTLAFASMPSGLFALEGLWRGFDYEQLARRLIVPAYHGAQSPWRGIQRVLPGEAVLFRGGREQRFRYWNPQVGPGDGARGDAVEEFRHLLDAAVDCRIADQHGAIAAHLSGGLDSSAVAATAARLRRPGQRVIAYTSAPREGFCVAPPAGLVSDESALAAATARMHGIEHVVVRPGTLDMVEHFRTSARFYQDPARNILNAQWGSQILTLAQQAGARVLLTGNLGNLSLTAGRPAVLQEWVRRGDWKGWWTAARAAAHGGLFSWRGILLNSFAPYLPFWGWQALHRNLLGVCDPAEASFVRPEWRRDVHLGPETWSVPQPSRDGYADRLQQIRGIDPGVYHHGALAEAGIDERDPTSDRRLVEFSLRLPPEQLFRNGRARALAREALRDRLPESVTNLALRGFQCSDWFERFTKADAVKLLDTVEASPAASEFLDIARLKRAIEQWPSGDWRDDQVHNVYFMALPSVFAAGVFLAEIEAIAGARLVAAPQAGRA